MLRRAAHVYEGKESTVEESVRVSRALGLREEEPGAGARENGSREVQARRKQTDRVGLPWGWDHPRAMEDVAKAAPVWPSEYTYTEGSGTEKEKGGPR
ncbi:hypothetical protein MRX96_043256 [Rhipicephalus microplus]